MVGTIFLILSIIIVFVVLYSWVLPKVLIKAEPKFEEAPARGLKKFVEKNGKTVLYLQNSKYRRYIKEYIISKRRGKVYFVARLAQDITQISFDIAVYNSDGVISKIVSVNDKIKKVGMTRIIVLPKWTTYAYVMVKGVNGDIDKQNTQTKVSFANYIIFVVASTILQILLIVVLQFGVMNLTAGIYYEEYLSSPQLIWTTVAASCLVLSINGIFLHKVLMSAKK